MRRSGVARRAAATRTTTGRPGTSSRGVAAPTPSPASGGALPTASSFPAQLRAGLGAAAARSTEGRREAPAGRGGPRALHPARAPCEGGIRPAPDSSRAPPAPGGPRPPPTGGRGDRPRGGGGAGSEAVAAPPRACGSLRPRGAAGTCLCLCGAGAAVGLCAAPQAGISLGACPAPGGQISGFSHPFLSPRSERSRLLGCVAVRHVLCRDFRRKIAPGPWEKKCYMQ